LVNYVTDPQETINFAKRISAYSYGMVAILSVVFFEYRSDILDSMGLVLFPYLTFVCVSVVMAYLLGGWYIHDSDRRIFEVLAVPILVILCSATSAGAVFGIATFVFKEPTRYSTLVNDLGGGIATVFLFILTAWPVLLVGACIVSTWMNWRFSKETVTDEF
jgi:hypothetical protein